MHIPEEWQRAEREREQTLIVFGVLSAVLLFGMLGIMVVYALLRWSKGQINTPTMILFFVAFLAWGALMQANGWSAGYFTLSTTEPLGHQLLMRIIGAVLLPAAGAAEGGVVAPPVLAQKRSASSLPVGIPRLGSVLFG